jgi:hypothetical protein
MKREDESTGHGGLLQHTAVMTTTTTTTTTTMSMKR